MRCVSAPSRGEALYELDEEQLEELQPDLIVTQAVCAVCAVSFDDVRAVAERLPSQPEVLSLDPATLGEVLGDVRTLAARHRRGGRGRRTSWRTWPTASTSCARGAGRRGPAARGRARVARPALHRRPLGAPDDRDRGRRGPARVPGRALAHGHLGGARGGPAGGGGLDALRLLRRACRARGDAAPRRGRAAGRPARGGGRRGRLLLPPRPAAGRRRGTARLHPSPRPRASLRRPSG